MFLGDLENTTSCVLDLVIRTNPNGDISWVSPGFIEMTGYSFEEVVGKNPRILKSDLHDSDFYKKMWDTISSKQIWEGVIQNKKKDGTIYKAFSRIIPIIDDGEIREYLCLQRDMSLYERLFSDIRVAEEKIVERAKEIDNANFIFKVVSEISEYTINQEIFNLDNVLKIAGEKLKMAFLFVQNCNDKMDIYKAWHSGGEISTAMNVEEIEAKGDLEELRKWVLGGSPFMGKSSEIPPALSHLLLSNSIRNGNQVFIVPVLIKQRPWGVIGFVNGNGHLWSNAERDALFYLGRLIAVMIEGNWEKNELLEHISFRFEEIESLLDKMDDDKVALGEESI